MSTSSLSRSHAKSSAQGHTAPNSAGSEHPFYSLPSSNLYGLSVNSIARGGTLRYNYIEAGIHKQEHCVQMPHADNIKVNTGHTWSPLGTAQVATETTHASYRQHGLADLFQNPDRMIRVHWMQIGVLRFRSSGGSHMRKENIPADLITLQEARRMLGVSADTLERRIAAEGLSKYRNPFDRRVRLLDRCEVESLLEFEVITPRERVA
jgi:hypothetical protein